MNKLTATELLNEIVKINNDEWLNDVLQKIKDDNELEQHLNVINHLMFLYSNKSALEIADMIGSKDNDDHLSLARHINHIVNYKYF